MSSAVRLLAAVVALVGLAGDAVAGLKPISVVHLIDRSEIITRAVVTSVADGYDAQNLPYTEISLRTVDTVKGDTGDTFTYRRFGLLAPRQRANGSWDLNVTPPEWPSYRQNDEVILFLFRAASETGFRSPIGLAQGALGVVDGEVRIAYANMGLFRDVAAEAGLLNSDEQALFSAEDSLPADVFMNFIERAVAESWIDEGRLFDVAP